MLGLAPSELIWIKSASSADAFVGDGTGAAQLELRSGAVLVHPCPLREPSAPAHRVPGRRNLVLALRPLSADQDSSPAPLRLTLRAAQDGIEIGFLKRRGPQRDEPLSLPLAGPANAGARGRGHGERSKEARPEVAPSAAKREKEVEEKG